jgi:hypothetical protein
MFFFRVCGFMLGYKRVEGWKESTMRASRQHIYNSLVFFEGQAVSKVVSIFHFCEVLLFPLARKQEPKPRLCELLFLVMCRLYLIQNNPPLINSIGPINFLFFIQLNSFVWLKYYTK